MAQLEIIVPVMGGKGLITPKLEGPGWYVLAETKVKYFGMDFKMLDLRDRYDAG